ncbi:hypothetical protein HYC85_005188 [Camellia sinensis]|uniref:Eukaryotic translation initiation factor 3 30 kDa subunit n=1 Tax=Camellia sinensis TaxID=4442 RepID=A0A7J7HYR5_CAMSI|nr:hypothetical protein HYC85_005188 [Camellia sinensis]
MLQILNLLMPSNISSKFLHLYYHELRSLIHAAHKQWFDLLLLVHHHLLFFMGYDQAPAPVPVPVPVPAPPAENVPKKKSAKVNVQKGKTVVVKEVPLDPLAEKLCQERLVEEADFKSTRDLFNRRGDEKTLDDFIPKSESDFLEYAELISHKLQPYEKSFHYIGLLKAVMRLSMTSLKAADAKEVASSITAIANEKLKAEKEANAGKKKPETQGFNPVSNASPKFHPVLSFLFYISIIKFECCSQGPKKWLSIVGRLVTGWEKCCIANKHLLKTHCSCCAMIFHLKYLTFEFLPFRLVTESSFMMFVTCLIYVKGDLTGIGFFVGPSLPAGAKKKQLHVDKPDDDVVVTAYDGYDDYDFM